MNPKFAVLGLGLLGIAAAFCAALLMATLKGGNAPKAASTDIEIIVAAQNIDARTAVEGEHVTVKKVSKSALPEGYLTDTVQVVGKRLLVHVVAGQPITKQALPDDSPGAKIAETLTPGMRAVSVGLSDYSGMQGLLYPGCMVDVISSYRATIGEDYHGSTISKTILSGVQVLAVEDETLFSDKTAKEDDGKSSKSRVRSSARKLMVTLMVDQKQAEVLQLAMESGAISLAMRNPGDDSRVADAGTSFNTPAPREPIDREPEPRNNEGDSDTQPVFLQPERPAHWDTTIHRGSESEVRSFELTKD